MIGILILTILGLIIGIILVSIDNKYKKDDKVTKIYKLLPLYNCGGCGYINCNNMAKEICNDVNCVYKCKPLKNKEDVVESILKILK